MADRGAPTAIDRSDARGYRTLRQERMARSPSPAATDRLAPSRTVIPLAARQRRRPDAENFGGEVSFCTSLLLHFISRRRHSNAQRLGALEVDNQLRFGG